MYSKFSRFCSLNNRYGIQNLIVYVLIGSIVVTLLQYAFPHAYEVIYFNPYKILDGEVWRLISFIFQPLSTNPISAFFFLAFYWWVGTTLERTMGQLKFTIFYFSSALMVLVYIMIVTFAYDLTKMPIFQLNAIVSTAPSYTNLVLFIALAAINPDFQIRLFMIIPIKIKWLALIDVVVILLSTVTQPVTLINITPLFVFLSLFIFFRQECIRFVKSLFPARGNAIRFKEAARSVREKKGYVHKCTQCGATDVDAPDTEFRYCSLCKNYACYCSQHIFTHEHN